MEIITNAVNDLKAMLEGISSTVALIGLLGLGMMYASSSIPLLKEWKEGHPKAFRDVAIGIVILTAASGIAALLS